MSRRLERQRQWLEQEKRRQEPPVVEETPPEFTKDLGREMFRLQQHKIALCKALRERTKQPIIVQLELDDQGWFFYIRGCPPVCETYQGVRCKFAPGILVGSAPNQA